MMRSLSFTVLAWRSSNLSCCEQFCSDFRVTWLTEAKKDNRASDVLHRHKGIKLWMVLLQRRNNLF